MSQRVAFVFPGQGSQSVGMGADVVTASSAARAIFDIADATLGFSLSQLCFEGPEEALRETINTQPAIVTTSLALLAALQAEAGGNADSTALVLDAPLHPYAVAGHSVGEYVALATAGALDIADTLRLVRERGRLMHAEGLRCPSGMAAVLGMDHATLELLSRESTEQALAELAATPTANTHQGAGRVVVANDNAPGQLVLSGEQRALEIAMQRARDAGARRVVPLSVSAAFHSPVMEPATEGLARAVAAAAVRAPHIPIISNISATPLTTSAQVRDELARQIAAPVQWAPTIAFLVGEGVDTFVEIGVGQVLSGLIKRIAKGATVLSVSGAADLAPVAQRLHDLLASD